MKSLLYHYTLLFSFLVKTSTTVFAQQSPIYQLEASTLLSTSNQTPFGIRSNQYGSIPLDAPALNLRASAHKPYVANTVDSTIKHKKLYFGYGVELVSNTSKKTQIILPEAYIKFLYKNFEFYAGRRKEIFGLVDTTLTSGSYIWSGNALPIPKIQLSIPNYKSIISKGLISIKGGYAHGWFDNGEVRNFYLHQKWFYGRIGRPNWKIKLHGGFNHQVQWGGKPREEYIEPLTGKLITNFGNDFKTYINAVTGISLNQDGDGLGLNGVPINEAWNRAGNHLGTIDFATEINLNNLNLLLYRQSIYDDGSLFYLSNISDGLLGLSIMPKHKKQGILKFCVEYLNTQNQGGNTGSGNTIPELRGRDNYFNNSIYRNGWTYKGGTNGTPFITPISQVNPELVKSYDLSQNSDSYLINNRVKAYSFLMYGKYKQIDFLTKLLWSQNLGNYSTAFQANQFSFIQQIKYKLPKYDLISMIGFDKGELYPNQLGILLAIRRTFNRI